jgi:hypothetical protein
MLSFGSKVLFHFAHKILIFQYCKAIKITLNSIEYPLQAMVKKINKHFILNTIKKAFLPVSKQAKHTGFPELKTVLSPF